MAINYKVTNADFLGSDLEDILMRQNIFTGGVVWSWGINDFGQLGQAPTTTRTSPGTIAGYGVAWETVSIGVANFAGIKNDGTLWTMGAGTSGQNGDNTVVNKTSPVTTVGPVSTGSWEDVAVGSLHMVAVKNDGTLWTWGSNGGALGDNTTVARSSPVTPAGNITDWIKCAAGNAFSAGVTESGLLYTWGANTFGQLGLNDLANRTSPQLVGTATNWINVSAGFHTLYAIKSDNTGWACGYNQFAQLGDGTTTGGKTSLVSIFGGYSWKNIAAGKFHAAGVQTNGTLWAWGQGTSGGIGDGFTVNRTTPVPVAGGGTTWKQVSCGYNSTAAVKTNGTLWTWGANAVGQLGNLTTVARSSPAQLLTNQPGLQPNNWRKVSSFYGTGAAASVAAIYEGTNTFPIIKEYQASGTETIPQGVSSMIIEVWGGGGSGGDGYTDGASLNFTGGGAGGGGYARSIYDVVGQVGKTLTISIGAGGSGSSGGNSTITSGTYTITTMTATGGDVGVGATSGGNGTPGLGGTGSGGNDANSATSWGAGNASIPGYVQGRIVAYGQGGGGGPPGIPGSIGYGGGAMFTYY